MDQALIQYITANVPAPVLTTIVIFLILSKLVGSFVAASSTPAPNTTWGRIYTYLEWFGGIYGKAKDVGIPVPEKPTVEQLEAEIAQLKLDFDATKKETPNA